MSKKIWMSVIGLAVMTGFAFAGWVCSSKAVASSYSATQSVKTGEWTASLSHGKDSGKNAKESGKINLNLERRSDRGGRNQSGQTYDLAELQGLSREQVVGGGPVKFSLVREAGTIVLRRQFSKRQRLGHVYLRRKSELCSGYEKPGL